MYKTRQAYFCYTCSEEVTFRGTRIRYNLDGSLHLCKADDKVAYEKYRKYTYDNTMPFYLIKLLIIRNFSNISSRTLSSLLIDQ